MQDSRFGRLALVLLALGCGQVQPCQAQAQAQAQAQVQHSPAQTQAAAQSLPANKPNGSTAQPGNFDPRQLFAPLELPESVNAMREGSGRPGPLYWQNRADYSLKATIDPAGKRLLGDEVITYTNNSPDALSELWLQLDQNMYRKDSRYARSASQPLSHTDGYQIESVAVEYAGRTIPVHYLVDDTRMRVDLPTALAARGGRLKLHVRYHYRMPGTWGDRTALTPTRNGDIYEVAQWYPRMAVYDDLRGWDTLPFLDDGEFYLEYGNFDYAVTVPWNYLVIGDGSLENPAQVLTSEERQRLARAARSDKTVYIRTPAEVNDPRSRPQQHGTLTWRYHMEHTRDVAFGASPAYIWDAARINLPDRKSALAMSAYPIEAAGKGHWDRSTEYVKGAVEYFSRKWRPFPWPTAINLAGHGAAMEYPGLAMDGITDADPELFWITAHELGHSWFPMVVGSNERRHAFMDEGFNVFMDVYASDVFNHGEFGPKRDSEYAPGGGNPVAEIVPLLADPKAPTLMAPADEMGHTYFHSVSYFKGALGLILLREQILGPQRFDPAFRAYIDTWAYKHPTPSDFFRFMESASGEDLGWWWRGWYLHNWQIDMGIAKAHYLKPGRPAQGVQVTLESRQKLVMPVTLEARYTDGTTQQFRIPVEVWRQQASPQVALPTTKALRSLVLDPDARVPDADRGNNTLSL